jgi:hypothetical protein
VLGVNKAPIVRNDRDRNKERVIQAISKEDESYVIIISSTSVIILFIQSRITRHDSVSSLFERIQCLPVYPKVPETTRILAEASWMSGKMLLPLVSFSNSLSLWDILIRTRRPASDQKSHKD